MTGRAESLKVLQGAIRNDALGCTSLTDAVLRMAIRYADATYYENNRHGVVHSIAVAASRRRFAALERLTFALARQPS